MPHHGHFVQSRLTIEDNNIIISYVSLHLMIQHKFISQVLVKPAEQGWQFQEYVRSWCITYAEHLTVSSASDVENITNN